MNYSSSDHDVRLDRFRASGKWYDTYTLNMSEVYDELFVHEAVAKAMKQNDIKFLGGERSFVVVLEPYHKNSYPVVLWNE